MKTKFTPLVKLKKDKLKEAETALAEANVNLKKAQNELQIARDDLLKQEAPQSGSISEFAVSNMLMSAQRETIKAKQKWVEFASQQVTQFKENLKFTSLDYEKFNYLESEQIKERLKEIAILEAKDLDEVALMSFMKKKRAS
ncbi:MAG: hypothetical protein GQ570_04670 [Helicobacteraceae bacterium]|nr:hypothetical protein [Helicobacteraceae bacterium]